MILGSVNPGSILMPTTLNDINSGAVVSALEYEWDKVNKPWTAPFARSP